jgi:hypothetical protein
MGWDDFVDEEPESQVPHSDPLASRRTPVVDDWVQWESQGVKQFPTPRRVRAVMEKDGEWWALVDGSDTGVPVKELTVVTEDGMPLHADPEVPAAEPELVEALESDDASELYARDQTDVQHTPPYDTVAIQDRTHARVCPEGYCPACWREGRKSRLMPAGGWRPAHEHSHIPDLSEARRELAREVRGGPPPPQAAAA